jgi:hypothetical protein
MTVDLKLEHCQRVSHAVELAITHAALSLSESAQAFVNEVLVDRRSESCLREISKRQSQAGTPERRLMEALKILVSHLWKNNAWISRGHYEEALLLCLGVAEKVDQINGAGLDGPAHTMATAYHRDYVLPIIEESFKTMWAAQEEISKALKKQKAQEKKLEKLKSTSLIPPSAD